MERRWSIRARLFVLVLAVAVPLVVVFVFSRQAHLQIHAQEAQDSALSLARLTAANVELFLTDVEGLLTRLARRPLVRAVDPARCDPLLADFRDLYPHFANIVVADLSGQIVCSAEPQLGGQPVSAADRQWFQTAIRTGGFAVGEPIVGRITGKWVSVLAYPIRDEAGHTVGALGLPVDLVRYQAVLSNVALRADTIITILDAAGVVVARSLEPEHWVGKDARGTEIVDLVLSETEGRIQAAGLNGVEQFFGFTAIHDTGWHVYAGVPADVALAPAQAAALRDGLFGLAALAVVGTLAFVFSREIQQPIRRLASVAQAVARGEFEARAPIAGPSEIAEVAARFNEMLDARAQAEKALRRLNEELEQRVAERTAQIEAANRELEAFSYSVSHDLRAPLRGIDGFSQALLEDYADRLDDEGRGYLRRVRAAAQRMAELIDALLTLSWVTRAEMRREPVDLSALARAIVAELQRQAPERQAECVVADGLLAQGDPRLLRAVLENLLGNAWKFTSKRPHAQIEFGAAQQRDGQPVYVVRDNGAGFDMAYADKLFGAFQRLHAMSEFGGTGIGLATVQRIIHRHGGRVWAAGAVDQGAAFYFTLG